MTIQAYQPFKLVVYGNSIPFHSSYIKIHCLPRIVAISNYPWSIFCFIKNLLHYILYIIFYHPTDQGFIQDF